MTRRKRAGRGLVLAALVLASLAAAGCGGQLTAVKADPPTAPPQPVATGTAPAVATDNAVPARVSFSRVKALDGSVITLATFSGAVRYVLHDGSQDPGPLAGAVRAGPKITGASRSQLLAAFNGGFLMKSQAGGYEQERHVASPLRAGLASLVIDASGRARIGVWGKTVPVPGEDVYSVRQNLSLLLSDGKPTAESYLWPRWGGTLDNMEYVARSAIGENAAGDLIYAASMSTTPEDLAWALEHAGAKVAMELDINPEWVQLDAATRPGGPLKAEIPGQIRPASQYLTGWTRDFIAVLAS
ncbi:MAG TPA: hypothetical protein VNV62_11095 [Trebonia sp.]|jgi:hypothetical protein|nr:hypothetical protein [Trebonia sp.]